VKERSLECRTVGVVSFSSLRFKRAPLLLALMFSLQVKATRGLWKHTKMGKLPGDNALPCICHFSFFRIRMETYKGYLSKGSYGLETPLNTLDVFKTHPVFFFSFFSGAIKT
jgi:stalled ribosome alternative rescue factor ArfA